VARLLLLEPRKADIVWIEPDKIPKIGYMAGAVTTFVKDGDIAAKLLDFPLLT
jgi:hypothetical protein